MIKLKYYLVLFTLIFIVSTPSIYATQNNMYQEGQIYQDPDNGKYYQIIDGKPYEIDKGSIDDGSISDAFKDYSSTTNPNAEVMTQVNETIVTPIGNITSFIIYIIFAMTAFTTVCDLLWIAVPPLRNYLYNGVVTNNIGSANANLLGRNTEWTNMAQRNMAQANQYNMNAQAYQQQAQTLAAMGDIQGAQSAMRRANGQAQLAQQQQNFARSNMQGQARSDAWRAQANQRTMESAQKRAENNQN